MTDIVEVRQLTKDYRSRSKSGIHRVVDQVSFVVEEGSSFGIVGESGSGKTTVSRVMLGLVAPTSGSVLVAGVDVWAGSRADRRTLPKLIQVVFQDPYSSMNPRMSIETVLLEGMRSSVPRAKRTSEAERLLDLVGLPGRYSALRPHQLSGGQRQRVAIARALATNPKVLVADEPVSALDVSMRGQVLNLLGDLRERLGLTIILISHDLGVVRQFCDSVVVMSNGEIVERGDPSAIFASPVHEYTRTLVASIPLIPGEERK